MDFLVTGANRGIGLELVRQILARGDRAIATARDPARAPALGALHGIGGDRLLVLPLDVASDESARALGAALAGRPLDVLVNNAGVYGDRDDLENLDFADALRTFDVNALGALRVTRALLPNLRAGAAKKLIHVTSRMGSIGDNGSGGSYGYRMSKAALNMAARSLAMDLGPEGFVSVAMNPGWVRTDMGGAGAPTSVEDCARGILAQIDRLGRAESGQFVDFLGRPHLPW